MLATLINRTAEPLNRAAKTNILAPPMLRLQQKQKMLPFLSYPANNKECDLQLWIQSFVNLLQIQMHSNSF
jgi:hypothetical protein